MRREGSMLYCVLVCVCRTSRRFATSMDETDLDTNALFKPIDKINKAIKAAGWIEDPAGPHDWCPRCVRYRTVSKRWLRKGGRYK